ncbi:MAG: MurR/RpiR family transcriptional regulator [Thermomicrobiales bacterium]
MAQATATFDLVEALRTHYSEMSAGQRRIADCLVQHEDEAQFLTAAQLAARVGLSESAVVRFAQFLGFSGYPDLRRAVCHDFRARATNKALVVSGRVALADQPDLIREIAHRDAMLIQETALCLDPAMLHRCAEAIVAAESVFVTGHRTSHALAEYLAHTLRQGIGVGTPLAFGTGMVYDVIGGAKPGDVLIAISITPYAQQTVDILCAAKGQGLRCIAITDHPLGAPARIADEVILFETALHVFTSSYVGVMTICHFLLAMVGQQAGDRADRFLAHVDPLNETFRTRHQPNGDEPCGKAALD